MDTLALSRLQFAVTSMFHWIFVPLTLGLSVLTAYMETKYVRTADTTYLRMTKFWGKLFLINFALGIVTGLTMEFQFGMNWAEYSKYVGDIFGAPLAIEATLAFFLESVFIGVWIFGWNKVSKATHALAIWIVALATNLSALWILLANGWMQKPVGYVLRNNRAEMTDFGALLTNDYGLLKFGHTLSSGYVVAAFFVMAISAYHLLRKNNVDFFQRSFKMAAIFGLASSLLVAVIGDINAAEIARNQPTKFAAMESLWETQKGVGFNLIVIPDTARECNAVEGPCVPRLLSYLAFHNPDAEIKGLKAFPAEERPPVWPVFAGFRVMVLIGGLLLLLSVFGVFYSLRGTLEQHRLFLLLVLYALPLPYIAGQLGWIVAEIGRQPWIVYGVLKTSQAVSRSVSAVQVVISLLGFTVLYSGLGIVDVYLLTKFARKGPEDAGSAAIPTR
ncbi:MAG TPA: cytochrome ubiquinol oxidase subunit I [Nitrospirota bacterium]|nr:cytochrome ubiquinol oxidase subunit I [Nitrospirota bacterium]